MIAECCKEEVLHAVNVVDQRIVVIEVVQLTLRIESTKVPWEEVSFVQKVCFNYGGEREVHSFENVLGCIVCFGLSETCIRVSSDLGVAVWLDGKNNEVFSYAYG